jgi:hypothetical protein
VVEPYGMADDIRRKPMPIIVGTICSHWVFG